ncbi:MAG TPA: PAS domain-containing protein, partial [Candidatus Binatia bacterium]|nr:PAS domain-containing protein [Candidatus Binatia bacterium]
MNLGTIEPNRGDAELRGSKDPFRFLFENSNDAVLLSGAEGIIEAANPPACRLFGWPEEAVRQIGLTSLVDPTDGRLPVLLIVQEQTGRFKGELIFKRKDGSVFLGEVCSVFYKDNVGIGKAT